MVNNVGYRRFSGGVGKEGADLLFQSIAHDNFEEFDDVGVPAGHQGLDLSQAGDGEAVACFVVHLESFQCDDCACGFCARTRDKTVGAFFDVIQSLVL